MATSGKTAAGLAVPDTKLAREATDLVCGFRDGRRDAGMQGSEDFTRVIKP